MNSKLHTWSTDGARRLLDALHSSPPATPGPHLTTEELDAFVADTLADDADEYASAHIEWCEECALAAEARLEIGSVVTDSVSVCAAPDATGFRQAARSPHAEPQLVFQPHHARQPGCVAPLERAARDTWEGIVIREPKHRPFAAKRLPPATIKKNLFPLVVTTAFRAAFEQRCGDQWSVAIPLAIAPRTTRIVTTKDSPIARLTGYELAKNLGGRCIAVADATSTFAARLVAAARHYRVKTVCVTERPRKLDSGTLYLVPMEFEAMSNALDRRRIHGFATVEPYPSAAKVLLTSRYSEAILGPQCTSQLTGFCCVVIAPRKFVTDPMYREAYDKLARTLFRSVWRVLRDVDLEVSMDWMPLEVGRHATAGLLRHLTDGLDLEYESDATVVEKLVTQLVPEVTPASLNADYEALSDFLSPSDYKRLKAAPPPVALYDTRHLRELCTESITRELAARHETPRAAMRNIGERLAAASQ